MRVIAGSARGRKLVTPHAGVRPTSDRVKEALFNILSPYLVGSKVLDLFAGTGALGIEALSRGADLAIFVDRDANSQRAIVTNLERSGLFERATLLRMDAKRAVAFLLSKKETFRFIFVDPPYDDIDKIGAELSRCSELLAEDGWLILEQDRKKEFRQRLGKLWLLRDQQYGQTRLLFYGRDVANEKNEE